MDSTVVLSFKEACQLVEKALENHGTAPTTANCVAQALTLADADGQKSHGLTRVPSYLIHLQSGKVDGKSEPTKRILNSSSIEINVNSGFAYPALELAADELIRVCGEIGGIAMVALVGSHHCGVAGHTVEKLAQAGHIGLMFANTPKAITAPGGGKPLLGTNPIAFACPRKSEYPIVIDLSLSQVARGRVVEAANRNEQVPSDWGIDKHGMPTTDPNEILTGSLNAIGGDKGSVLALMVEILAAAFTGSRYGYQAASFFDGEGSPPQVGQLLLGMKANQFSPNFYSRIEELLSELRTESGIRIPGERRFINRIKAKELGLKYPRPLIDMIRKSAV